MEALRAAAAIVVASVALSALIQISIVLIGKAVALLDDWLG